ncbi:MAG TPA: DUF3102 domain-containing protein [Candidatus Handelsmanbacteria bacterium]|nr:DUF3102 domain-containing protein [Candidatus Handelsmanbacteria bacterium]
MAIDYATQCGVALAEAKEKVGHGNWSEWLAANCAVSNRTASDWMRFAKNKDALAGAKSQRKALATLVPEPEEKAEIQIGTTGADLSLSSQKDPDPPEAGSDGDTGQTWEDFVSEAPVEDPKPAKPPESPETIKNRELESFARRLVSEFKDPPATAWLNNEEREMYREHLKSAAHVIRSAKVTETCPRCGGEGCRHCRDAGMVPKRVGDYLS